jgi:RNA polymerase sigma-70 factor (ECF subfamily)
MLLAKQHLLPAPAGRSEFRTTHWNIVLAAQVGASSAARSALETLCRAYWYPLYAFVRRSGYDADDAQDLTQEFFARLLENQWLAEADPARGRFRSFLLAALKHFLANEWHRAHCARRGGGCEFIALDAATAEERYALEPPDLATPELLYDRRWALTLLAHAQERLQAEMSAGRQRERFAALESTLTGERAALPYRELAARFGVTETAVKSMVLRLRRRFRDLLREEVAHTIGNAEDVDAELANLFEVLGGGGGGVIRNA